jgi:hypothetical protein
MRCRRVGFRSREFCTLTLKHAFPRPGGGHRRVTARLRWLPASAINIVVVSRMTDAGGRHYC